MPQNIELRPRGIGQSLVVINQLFIRGAQIIIRRLAIIYIFSY